jgi:hypothetical protein
MSERKMTIVLSRKKMIIASVALVVCLAAAVLYAIFSRGGSSGHILHPDAKDYIILIQIDDKKLYLLNEGHVVRKYTIASGMSGWPSPIGDWQISNKGIWGEGFGARWLGLDVPWGAYGIHGTTDEGRIGQPVSHGCIRMRNQDVIELYDMVELGTPVIIRNGPYGPFGLGFATIIPGDRGSDVLAVQKKLKELGYFDGYESGIYEDDLKHALHEFQRDHGLPVENSIDRDDFLTMGFLEFE